MRELTSSFDDLEKRMAIFIGLGAFLFNSLYCLIKGASFETFIIQGGVIAFVFMLASYSYSHWLRALVKENSPDSTADNENIEFRTVDAEHLAEEVISTGDLPDTVIEEAPGEVISGDPASFQLPNFDSPSPSGAAVTAPPLPPLAPLAPAAAPAFQDKGEDLPPPPVPPGV